MKIHAGERVFVGVNVLKMQLAKVRVCYTIRQII